MARGHHISSSIQRLMLQSFRTCHISQRVSPHLLYFQKTSLSSTNTLGCIRPRALHCSHSLCEADRGHKKMQDDFHKPPGSQPTTSASQIKSFSVLKYIKTSLPFSLKVDIPIGKFSTGSGTEMGKNLGFTARHREAQASYEIKVTDIFACGLFLAFLMYLQNGRNRVREKLIMALAVDKNMIPVLNTQPADGTGQTPITINIADIENTVLKSGENLYLQSQDDAATNTSSSSMVIPGQADELPILIPLETKKEDFHKENLSKQDHDAIGKDDVLTCNNEEGKKKVEREKRKPFLFLIDRYKISTISQKNQENC